MQNKDSTIDTLVAATNKVASLPARTHDGYLRLLAACKSLPPVRIAVVHPCSTESLEAALEARNHGLIEPVIVGPEARIRALAQEQGLNLQGIEIVATEHSHASAETAVALARTGKVAALMKGSLHTDELLHAVLMKEGGLRTARRLSHVFVMELPNYPRPLLITDAVVNIYPDLAAKCDIAQNAIDLAHRIGIAEPRVAILSALETVNPAIVSTLHAAALCKMAERGQITGGKLDGPLALDVALDPAAARIKGIRSGVAGVADILVVPDLEAGNILVKQLTFLDDADSAGVVLGARVPIVLTSRADSVRNRLASVALGVLLTQKPATSGVAA